MLAAQAGTARAVVFLANQSAPLLAPHAPQLLQALSGALRDTSATVARLMSGATAQVARLCPPATVEKLVAHLTNLYLNPDTDGGRGSRGGESAPRPWLTNAAFSVSPGRTRDADATRATVRATCLDIVRHAPAVANAIGGTLVPLAVLGAHEATDEAAAQWRQALDELAHGRERSVRTHLAATLALLQTALASPSWALRKQAALGLATVANLAGACARDGPLAAWRR